MNMANELDLRRKQEISGQQTLQTLADRLTLADLSLIHISEPTRMS